MFFQRTITAAIVLSAVLATGCASVKMASVEADTAAKTFATVPDKAKLYVYRNESFGAAIKMPVAIDGALLGDTAAHTFLMRALPPGKHTIVSKTENDAELTLDMEAGKNYYVWQEVKMGLMSARSALKQVDEATGQAAVKECKLAE